MLGVDSIKNALNESNFVNEDNQIDTNPAPLSSAIDSVATYKRAEATAAGVCSSHRHIATADTNLNNVKATAGRIYKIIAGNKTASPLFLKLYNKVSAPVIANDASLIIETLMIPANGNLDLNFEIGLYFSAGISYALTGLMTDTDTTALSAGDICLNIQYM